MSASVNKVILVGNLGSDPELRFLPSGSAVANFSIATNEKWRDKDGNKQERVEWHRIVVWNTLAEICTQYLHKGSSVYIEGKLQTREWEDKDGNKRWTTQVVGWSVQFLDPANKVAQRKVDLSQRPVKDGGTCFGTGVDEGELSETLAERNMRVGGTERPI
jgi:single-strand DNA-binding protein